MIQRKNLTWKKISILPRKKKNTIWWLLGNTCPIFFASSGCKVHPTFSDRQNLCPTSVIKTTAKTACLGTVMRARRYRCHSATETGCFGGGKSSNFPINKALFVVFVNRNWMHWVIWWIWALKITFLIRRSRNKSLVFNFVIYIKPFELSWFSTLDFTTRIHQKLIKFEVNLHFREWGWAQAGTLSLRGLRDRSLSLPGLRESVL